MTTEIALCETFSCSNNQTGTCARTFVILDQDGQCASIATQPPLPEPPGPNNEPSFIGPVKD